MLGEFSAVNMEKAIDLLFKKTFQNWISNIKISKTLNKNDKFIGRPKYKTIHILELYFIKDNFIVPFSKLINLNRLSVCIIYVHFRTQRNIL